MAWAERTSSGRWRGLYRDASGRRHTVAGGPFTRKSEAERRAGSAEDDARRQPGRATPGSGKLTWGSWADVWWPRRKVEPGTRARQESLRTKHLGPRWEQTRLAAITRDAVQQWVDDLSEGGLSAGSVRNCYYLLAGSLRDAVTAGHLPATPCAGIDLPTQPIPDARYLTWDEVAAVAHFLQPDDAVMVWWLAGTGMRWGEAAGAHRHRLDLDAGRVDVHEVWDVRTGEIKPWPKGRRRRSVPLPVWLTGRLAEHFAAHPEQDRPTCGSPHRGGHRCQSALVLPGRGGVVRSYDKWWAKFQGACARAKLANIRIHDLRHSYASWLLQDGVSIEAVSDLLGHASVATTMRYAHLADTQWGQVRQVLDSRAASADAAAGTPGSTLYSVDSRPAL